MNAVTIFGLTGWLAVAGLIHGADLAQLIQQAQKGNRDAVLELAAHASPEARNALRNLPERPVDYYYNRSLKAAKAKVGLPDALLDLTIDVFFGDSPRQLDATEDFV